MDKNIRTVRLKRAMGYCPCVLGRFNRTVRTCFYYRHAIPSIIWLFTTASKRSLTSTIHSGNLFIA